MHHLAPELSLCLNGIGHPSGVRSVIELFWCFAQSRVDAANAEAHQRGFHPVGNASALANRLLALAGGTFRILLFQRGLCCSAFLAARPAKLGTLEKPRCSRHTAMLVGRTTTLRCLGVILWPALKASSRQR